MNGFKLRGVVEGFYGKPWTWQERKDMIRFMGENGYTLYIYAPKADQLHRDQWRQMYEGAFEENFQSLIDTGKTAGVDISMAISPGLSLVHSDETDLNILKQKYLTFAAMGVRTISLFLDDIPPELIHQKDKQTYQSLAHAQSDFANQLYLSLANEIKNIRFILCPTIYHGTTMCQYHHTLGEKLHKDIQIMWTGPKVCSEKLTVENAQMVAKAFNRKPLFWDNFPVNDSVMVPELHIGRFSGRDGNLGTVCEGFIVNPMNQAYASMSVLKNISFYLNDPQQYNPDEALMKSFEQMYPQISSEMLTFSKACNTSPLNPGDPEITVLLLEQLEQLRKKGQLKQMSILLNENSRLICEAYDRIVEKIDQNLLADIEPWLNEYIYYGRLMNQMASVLEKIEVVYRDEHPPAKTIDAIHEANRQLEKSLEELARLKTRIFGKGLREYALELAITCKGLVKLVDW